MISRVPAEHTCPECRKTPVSTWSTALSGSASANTMCGFLPPSSSATLVTCLAAVSAMVRPVGHSAGERDEVDCRRVGQRRADRSAASLHEVDHRGRHACLVEQVDERDRGQRRDLTGLGDHGAACGQGRRDLPRHLQQRVVPRRDEHADPDRFAHDAADDGRVPDVDDPVGFDAYQLRVVAENRCDVVDVDPAFDQGLAGVPGFQRRQILFVALQQVGDPVEQGGAFGHRRCGPCAVVERGAGGGDGISGIVGGGLVDDRGDAAGGRIDDLPRPAVGRVPPLPADTEIRFTVHKRSPTRRRDGTLPTDGTPRCDVRRERVRRLGGRHVRTSTVEFARMPRSPAR